MAKRLSFGLLVLLMALLAFPAAAAEMRGLWVDSWNAGFKSPQETATMVTKAKECNFNALFVQVRRRGDVYYKSSIEPMALDAAKDYDPLADIISKGHAAGLQVHAWVVAYEVYHDVPEVKPQPTQVHLKHPDWLMKNEDGYKKLPGDKLLLDPGIPAVQDYLVSIVEEIATKYDIDGIHLDMVRYLDLSGGYSDKAVSEFNRVTGRFGNPRSSDPEWCKWRKEQISLFVRRAQQRLHQIKPKAQLSASVFANLRDATDNKLQDWEQWLKDGIVDFVSPMVFIEHGGVFERTLKEDMALARYGKPIYAGIAGYKINAAAAIEHTKIARKCGANGILLYSYFACDHPRPGDTKSIMDTLREDLFAKPEPAPTASGAP